MEAPAGGFNGGLQILEDLFHLRAKVVFADEIAGLIERYLTGDEHDLAAGDNRQLRVRHDRAVSWTDVFFKSMLSIKEIDPMNLAAMGLNLLNALESLLAEASVGRAAERMNLSKPAMSHALKRLRQIFRDPRLVRVGPRMQLTSRGESLRFPVEDALARVRDLLASEAFDPARSQRTFHLSLADHVSGVLLSPLLQRLAKDAPSVAIRLQPPSVAAFDPVELSREVDAVIACAPIRFKGFYQQRLFSDRDACAMRKGHRIAKRLTRDSFLNAHHVAVVTREFSEDPVDTWLREEGCSRNVVLTVPTYLQALHVVAGSDLIAMLPERLVCAHSTLLGVAVREVPLDVGTFDEYLLHPARTHADPGCVWLRNLIREVATSLH
jgi:DNA-binding transcriptional LysR family regulator